MSNLLDKTYTLRNPEIYILGDLNINLLNKSSTEYKNLKYFSTSHNLSHFIDCPTQITETTATCIDLIMCNRDEIICSAGSLPFGCTDHSLVSCQRKLNWKKPAAIVLVVCLLAARITHWSLVKGN